MNILKRAITSIKRRPEKTVILLLIIFILGNIISGAISIQQAVGNTEANLRRSLPAVATIEQNWDEMVSDLNTGEEIPTVERLTPELLRQIGSLPYVEDFDYSAPAPLFSSELERVVHPDPEFESVDWDGIQDEDLEQFLIKGVHNPEVVDINGGLIELVNGRTFTEQEIENFNGMNSVVLISQDFANLNNLTVGSTFTLDNTMYEFSDNNWQRTEENVAIRETYEFEVIGIFDIAQVFDTGDRYEDARRELQLQNRIYAPNAVSEDAMALQLEFEMSLWDDEDIELELEDWLRYTNVFLLRDPMDLADFAMEASELLPDYWVVNDLSNTFGDIATSMETLQWLASLVLWIAIGATILILSLLITLFLRDRKHEIGIYLALGEKKLKVALQIILEVVATGVVAITLSLFTGSLMANSISQNMIRKDLIAAQQPDDFWGGGMIIGGDSDALGWFSNGTMSVEEMLENYDLSLSGKTIVLLYSVGIGTLLISTVVPIIYVMRLNPKKIMM